MTAFELGYDAFLKGVPIGRNPFDKETCPYSCKYWIRGWAAAQLNRAAKVAFI